MIAWSVVLSIPMAFVDWRIPLIALKLDWQYVPLVIAGYLLASEHEGVRRLLTGFVLFGIPACLDWDHPGAVRPGFPSSHDGHRGLPAPEVGPHTHA